MDSKHPLGATPLLAQKVPAILLFGPPGSGKGTLGNFLSTIGGHYHLSSGDIFRKMDPDSSLGRLVNPYSSRGHLVPDEVTMEVWAHYVAGLIATNRYFPKDQYLLMDGLPRTLHQAEILDQYVHVKAIIRFVTHRPEELVARIQRRAKIEGRRDDMDAEVLKTRMQVYEQQTAPVLSHYPEALVTAISVDQRPLEVLRDILDKLSSVLAYPPAEAKTSL